MNLIPRRGLLLLGADNADALALRERAQCRVETFGLSDGADWQAHDLRVTGTSTTFSVRRDGTPVGQFELPLLGAYNVRNALAAIAIGAAVGLHTDTLARRAAPFQGRSPADGTSRHGGGVAVYDDFAHHPTAIEETLAGVRSAFPNRRVWAIFEPRSATSCRRIFQSDFARALAKADTVILPAVFRSTLPEEERLSVEQLIADLEDRPRRRPVHPEGRRHRRDRRPGEPRRRSRRDHVQRRIRRHPRKAADGPRRTQPQAVNSLSSDLVRVAAAGDSALVAEFPERIDPDVKQRALALAARLRGEWGEILRDVVIGYCTVTVYFDPRHVDARWLEGEIRVAARDIENGERPAPRTIEVPVCYGVALGPDLEDVAAFGACSIEDVIELHTTPTYRVYVVGFVPGFAYMAEVDPRIARPRRSSPRTAVPAGSVAIAGGQTGIYPKVTPGGWNIVGRTPLKPYDPERERSRSCSGRRDACGSIPMTREAFEWSAG